MDVAGRWGQSLGRTMFPGSGGAPASRALVVRTRVGDRAMLSPRISFLVIDRSKVFSLPELLLGRRGAAMISGIVFGDAGEPLIVLNPEGWLDAYAAPKAVGGDVADISSR